MDVLKWLPTAVAVVIFLGAATVYLRGSRDKGTIQTLTANNAALTERVTILEASEAHNTVKLKAQEQTIEVLTNTVNSSELIQELKSDVLAALLEHHGAAMTGLEQLHGDLAGLPALIAAAIKEKP